MRNWVLLLLFCNPYVGMADVPPTVEVTAKGGLIGSVTTSGVRWRTLQLGDRGEIDFRIPGEPVLLNFDNADVYEYHQASKSGDGYICSSSCRLFVKPHDAWSGSMSLRFGNLSVEPIRLEIAPPKPLDSNVAGTSQKRSVLTDDREFLLLIGGAILLPLAWAIWIGFQHQRQSRAMDILQRSLLNQLVELKQTIQGISRRMNEFQIAASRTKVAPVAHNEPDPSAEKLSPDDNDISIDPPVFADQPNVMPQSENKDRVDRDVEAVASDHGFVEIAERITLILHSIGTTEPIRMPKAEQLTEQMRTLSEQGRTRNSGANAGKQLETLRNSTVVQAIDSADLADPRRANSQLQADLRKLAEAAGLAVISPMRNEPFDPKLHAAIRSVPRGGPDDRPRAIAEVLARGVRSGDNILRQASVALFE